MQIDTTRCIVARLPVGSPCGIYCAPDATLWLVEVHSRTADAQQGSDLNLVGGPDFAYAAVGAPAKMQPEVAKLEVASGCNGQTVSEAQISDSLLTTESSCLCHTTL